MAKRLISAMCVGMFAVSASAANLPLGTYDLLNHPNGSARPPLYGARLDELFNVTGGHDIFTFDFEAAGSAMFMDLTATSIHIYGQSWGGRDTGSGYAADVYRGFYTFNFTYNLGLMAVPGDDDKWVNTTNHINTGTVVAPNGLGTTQLVDERGNFGYSLRLGDENNDAGHRGFSGISGWGWMSYNRNGTISHTPDSDWLFTARFTGIPTPGTAALMGLGLLTASRRRR